MATKEPELEVWMADVKVQLQNLKADLVHLKLEIGNAPAINLNNIANIRDTYFLSVLSLDTNLSNLMLYVEACANCSIRKVKEICISMQGIIEALRMIEKAEHEAIFNNHKGNWEGEGDGRQKLVNFVHKAEVNSTRTKEKFIQLRGLETLFQICIINFDESIVVVLNHVFSQMDELHKCLDLEVTLACATAVSLRNITRKRTRDVNSDISS